MKKNTYISKIPTMTGLLCLMFFLIVVYLLLDANSKKKTESLTMRQNKMSNISKKLYNSSKRNIRNKYNDVKKQFWIK